jgi:hypothetical protein
MLHTHLSSGAGTRGQLVADVPSGLSLTRRHEKRKVAQTVTLLTDIRELCTLKSILFMLYKNYTYCMWPGVISLSEQTPELR